MAQWAAPYLAAATAGAFGAATTSATKKLKGYIADTVSKANEEVHQHVANVFHQASVALKGARHTSAAPFGTKFFKPPRIGRNRARPKNMGPIPPRQDYGGSRKGPHNIYNPQTGDAAGWSAYSHMRKMRSRSSKGIETMAWKDPFRTDYKVDTELRSLHTRKPRKGFETYRASKGSIFFRRR